VVIVLSTGNTKKKPMTKKEREEKRREKKKAQGKTLEQVRRISCAQRQERESYGS
jgi:hypothetical protein